MEHTIEDLGISRKRIRFEVPVARVTTALNKAYSELKKTVRLRGFRPGKVPRNILESRFGERIRAEVASELVQECWKEVAPQVNPLGRPNLDHEDLSAGSPFVFSITTDVTPEITVDNYLDIQVPWVEPEVTDEQVEASVKQRLESKKSIVEVDEDQAITDGDIVITELTLADGEEELIQEAGTAIHVGDEHYYPGVDGLLLGMKRGEQKTATVTIGTDTPLEAVAGRELEATVKVLAVQTQQVPELTDELAAELGFEGGAAGMRLAIQEQIREDMAEQLRNAARMMLLHKVVANNSFTVPDSLVEERYNLMIEEAKALHAYRGNNPNTFTVTPKNAAEYRNNAVINVQSTFILNAIARQESIEVGEDDLNTAYQKMADERGQTVEAIKGYFIREDATELLKERLLEQKTLDWLLERAQLMDPADLQGDESPVTSEDPPADMAVAADETAAEE